MMGVVPWGGVMGVVPSGDDVRSVCVSDGACAESWNEEVKRHDLRHDSLADCD